MTAEMGDERIVAIIKPTCPLQLTFRSQGGGMRVTLSFMMLRGGRT